MVRRKRKAPWDEFIEGNISYTEYNRRKDKAIFKTILYTHIVIMIVTVIIIALCTILL